MKTRGKKDYKRKKLADMPTVERAVAACRNPHARPRERFAIMLLLSRR